MVYHKILDSNFIFIIYLLINYLFFIKIICNPFQLKKEKKKKRLFESLGQLVRSRERVVESMDGRGHIPGHEGVGHRVDTRHPKQVHEVGLGLHSTNPISKERHGSANFVVVK